MKSKRFATPDGFQIGLELFCFDEILLLEPLIRSRCDDYLDYILPPGEY